MLNPRIERSPIITTEVVISENWMKDGIIRESFMKEAGLRRSCWQVGFGYMEEKEELIVGKTVSVLRRCQISSRPQ